MGTVLALNCGSSSLKFGLYEADARRARLLCEGEGEEIGGAHASFWFKREKESKNSADAKFNDHSAALNRVLQVLGECGTPKPEAVGHRFVHGGARLREHRLLDTNVMKDLESAVEYAPLHMPAALAVLRETTQKMPGIPQVICLDTAFHRTMPEVSRTYGLPQAIRNLGVERYGFHGLSLESIVDQLAPLPEHLVVAHLGNGSSITAIHAGKSVDTSMGLTPTGGVMMGTRCGDLDPGLLTYLMRHGYGSADQLEKVVDQESGLKGVSGISSDVRELQSRRKQDKPADLALQMFCYQVRKAIAAMAAALGGVDTIVFTGGIGEHDEEVRASICEGLKFLGQPQIKVLPSQEDEQIAKNTARLTQHSEGDEKLNGRS